MARGHWRGKPLATVRAFGETKSLAAWVEDPRSGVRDPDVIRQRLRLRWEPQDAIATPPCRSDHRDLVEIFGERKPRAAWARDPRAQVRESVFRWRIRHGWDPERALTVLELDPSHVVEVFGERKSCPAWGRDPRAKVTARTFRNRVCGGWPPEVALTTPAHSRLSRKSRRVVIWGEIKSCRAWGRDPRAKVSRTALLRRLVAGWPPEEALTTAPYAPRPDREGGSG